MGDTTVHKKPVATGVGVKTGDGAVQRMVRSHVTGEKQAAVWIHPEAEEHIPKKTQESSCITEMRSNTRLFYDVNRRQLRAGNGVTGLLTQVKNVLSNYPTTLSVTVVQAQATARDERPHHVVEFRITKL